MAGELSRGVNTNENISIKFLMKDMLGLMMNIKIGRKMKLFVYFNMQVRKCPTTEIFGRNKMYQKTI
jgi:hypothetical protein